LAEGRSVVSLALFIRVVVVVEVPVLWLDSLSVLGLNQVLFEIRLLGLPYRFLQSSEHIDPATQEEVVLGVCDGVVSGTFDPEIQAEGEEVWCEDNESYESTEQFGDDEADSEQLQTQPVKDLPDHGFHEGLVFPQPRVYGGGGVSSPSPNRDT